MSESVRGYRPLMSTLCPPDVTHMLSSPQALPDLILQVIRKWVGPGFEAKIFSLSILCYNYNYWSLTLVWQLLVMVYL